MSPPTARQLERNIQRMLAFSFLQAFMVLMPVIVLFFESRGLTLSEVLLLQAWFAVLVLIFEVPSGYLADLLGRKRTLVVGALFGGVGHAVLLFAEGFWQLAIFEACLAIGFSLMSGANLALLYDTELALRDTAGRRPRAPRAVGRLFFIRNLSEALGAFACSLLLLWSMEAAMYAQVASAWVAFALTFGLVEPPREQLRHDSHAGNLRAVLRHLVVDDRILRLTFLALCLWPLTTMFATWLLQKHWEGQEIDVLWFGCLWGGLTLVAAAAGKYALVLEDRIGATAMLLIVGFAPVLGYLGLGGLGAVGGVLASAVFFACRGFGGVVLRQALNKRVPSSFRATANSFASLGFRGGFALTAPVVGAALDLWGMTATFLLLAIGSLGICVALLLPLVAAVRELRPAAPADSVAPAQPPSHSSHQPCGDALASSSAAVAEPPR